LLTVPMPHLADHLQELVGADAGPRDHHDRGSLDQFVAVARAVAAGCQAPERIRTRVTRAPPGKVRVSWDREGSDTGRED